MAEGFNPDPATGKPIYDGNASDPTGQFQAAADFAEDQTSITVPTWADLGTLPIPKRPGMLVWVTATDQVARYNGTDWGVVGGVSVDGTSSITMLAGWTTNLGSLETTLVRLPSKDVMLTVRATKNDAINPNGDGVLTVPTGFRPTHLRLDSAVEWSAGNPAPIAAQVHTNGQVIVWGTASTKRSISFSTMYRAV